MSKLQQASAAKDAAILDLLEAKELEEDAKQEFISSFIARKRHEISGDMTKIAEIAMDASGDKYNRLFDCIAELSYSGASKALQAVIDEIIDDHLEEQAAREWEAYSE